jgi:hypothetical protein
MKKSFAETPARLTRRTRKIPKMRDRMPFPCKSVRWFGGSVVRVFLRGH